MEIEQHRQVVATHAVLIYLGSLRKAGQRVDLVPNSEEASSHFD